MAVRFVYRREVEDEIRQFPELLDALEEMGDEIAARTVSGSPMGSSQPGRYGTPKVTRGDGKVTVATDGPFAHLDEWGSVNNGPSAAMRRAAASVGKFKES